MKRIALSLLVLVPALALAAIAANAFALDGEPDGVAADSNAGLYVSTVDSAILPRTLGLKGGSWSQILATDGASSGGVRNFTLNTVADGSGAVFAKWDEAAGEMVMDETEEEEFPFTFITSPEAAAKADNPEETVVFYEDPNDFFDGIFVVFGDGSVKFLEGDFDDHAEAMEAAVNTFGISEKAAGELLKKAAAIDKMLED